LTTAVPELELSDEDRLLLARGMDEFNTGLFFECHDTLEEVWAGIRGPSRDFLQGLIQVAVGFYHLGNDNRSGAVTMFRRALGRLAKYGDRHGGIELAGLRHEVQEWLARVEAGGPLPAGLDSLPKLVTASAGPRPGPSAKP
jgi:predicted metal-dependent hydrolase